jgi:hypothetical protein
VQTWPSEKCRLAGRFDSCQAHYNAPIRGFGSSWWERARLGGFSLGLSASCD